MTASPLSTDLGMTQNIRNSKSSKSEKHRKHGGDGRTGKTLVVCLHGFLGQPEDLKRFFDSKSDYKVLAPNLLTKGPLGPIDPVGPTGDFTEWAQNFYKWLEEAQQLEARQETPQETQPGVQPERRILVGYSMGGRLALCAARARPTYWSQVILVSVFPGFRDGWVSGESLERFPERLERWQQDLLWGEQFLKSPWKEVLMRWRAQNVFAPNSLNLSNNLEGENLPEEYREILALALAAWSQAKQENFRDFIAKYADKISVILGARDRKYCEIWGAIQAEALNLKIHLIPDAGHRVFEDNPKVFRDILNYQ